MFLLLLIKLALVSDIEVRIRFSPFEAAHWPVFG
jgi:hypothetical protein